VARVYARIITGAPRSIKRVYRNIFCVNILEDADKKKARDVPDGYGKCHRASAVMTMVMKVLAISAANSNSNVMTSAWRHLQDKRRATCAARRLCFSRCHPASTDFS
jgi:hypothetical protein